MADPVADITKAPKRVFAFASNNLIAFALLALVLLVVFIKWETQKPGDLREKVAKLPGVGRWATTPSA